MWNARAEGWSEVTATVLVPADLSIAEALNRMDAGALKILFVVDQQESLLGVVTDGDIRRRIIAGDHLGGPIGSVMNTSPITLRRDDYSAEEARSLLVSSRVDCIPLLDDLRRVVGVVRWIDFLEPPLATPKSINYPVVVMAGGMGTRLFPVTRVLPKALIPVGETPMIEHVIQRFVEQGCGTFYLSVGHKAGLIKAYFADLEHDYKLEIFEETEPLGTAGALSLMKHHIGSTFFVTNCDILVDASLNDFIAYHESSGNLISIVGSVIQMDIPYGVCHSSAGGRISRIEEKPSHHFLVSTGVYLLDSAVLNEIPDGTHCHLTDVINTVADQGGAVGVYPISERSWLDLGHWDKFNVAVDRLHNEQTL